MPKAGGTFVLTALKALGVDVCDYDRSDLRKPGESNFFRIVSPQHLTAPAVRNLYRLDRVGSIHMVVRDPLDRLTSEYFWQRRRAQREDDPALLAFADWWSEVSPSVDKCNERHDNHLAPQVNFWIEDAVVHRFENGLEGAVANVAKTLGISTKRRLRSASRRASKNSAGNDVKRVGEIGGDLLKSVYECYREDYEVFGYPPPM